MPLFWFICHHSSLWRKIVPNDFQQFPNLVLYVQKRCARGDTAPLTVEAIEMVHDLENAEAEKNGQKQYSLKFGRRKMPSLFFMDLGNQINLEI